MHEGIKQETSKAQGEAPEPEQKRYRQYRGPMAVVTGLIGGGLSLFFLVYIGGALPQAGFYFIQFQLNGIFLCGMLVLVFLLIPGRKGLPRDRLPWYDVLLALASLAICIYIIINAWELSDAIILHANSLQMVLGFMAYVALLEAIRRTIGWTMVIVLVVFLLYSRFGYLLPESPLSIHEQVWDKIIACSYIGVTGMFGSIITIASNIIIAFIGFGIFFMKVGGGEVFLNLALSLTGRMRGGPAKAAIVGSAAFGTLSSSPLANVAVTGSITIPLMKRTGYSPTFAAAVESVASTGGQIMPPVMGSVAFVMAALLGVSYASVALAAAIPAILYYVALFVQTDLRAAKDRLRGIPQSELPSFWATLKGGWEFGIPLLFLVVLLFVLRYPPPLCGVYSIGALIVISMFRKRNRLNLKQFIGSLESVSRSMLIIAPALAAAGIIIGLLGMSGLGPRFASGLVAISGGSMLVLFVLAGVSCYILGMGGAMILSYILLALLVAPALELVGVPLMVSHFFIFYMALTMFFTPPYCPVAFIAAGIADTRPYPIGFQAMRLGIVTYLVPFILVYNPVLILMGEPLEIALAAVTAIIGVFALSIGVERYLFTRTNWVQTILAIGAGITMMLPGWQSDVVGAGLLAVVVLWQWGTRKARALATTVE